MTSRYEVLYPETVIGVESVSCRIYPYNKVGFTFEEARQAVIDFLAYQLYEWENKTEDKHNED